MKNSDEKKRIVKAKIPRAKNAKNHKVAEEAIRQRAFEIYLARGGEPGYALDDWLRAKRELTENKP
jgi:hypothetical protein